jgi:hypothetical protein
VVVVVALQDVLGDVPGEVLEHVLGESAAAWAPQPAVPGAASPARFAAACGEQVAARTAFLAAVRDGHPSVRLQSRSRDRLAPRGRAGVSRRQRRDEPGAAAARAFAVRHVRKTQAARHQPRPSRRVPEAAQSVAAGPRGWRRPAAAATDRVQAWRARYWIRRRCRSGRRSSGDARCCRAVPAPGGGVRPPRRHRSRRDAASFRGWCWLRAGWRRIGESATPRRRSGPGPPQTRRRIEVPACFVPGEGRSATSQRPTGLQLRPKLMSHGKSCRPGNLNNP